jgi:hypothetical protein
MTAGLISSDGVLPAERHADEQHLGVLSRDLPLGDAQRPETLPGEPMRQEREVIGDRRLGPPV